MQIFEAFGFDSNVRSSLYNCLQMFPTSASVSSGLTPDIGPSIQFLKRKILSSDINNNKNKNIYFFNRTIPTASLLMALYSGIILKN